MIVCLRVCMCVWDRERVCVHWGHSHNIYALI